MPRKSEAALILRDENDFSPFPVAVRAGDFIFAPCVVNLAAAARRPLDVWPSRHDAKTVLGRLRATIERAGGSMDDLVNLLQCFQGRGQTAGYVQERVGHFAKGVPTSTGTAATRLAMPAALIQLDAVGIAPSEGKVLEYIGGASKNASYSNAIAYGDIVYFSGVMTSAPETQPDPNLWFGSAVKNELKSIVLDKLAPIAKQAGCDISDIAVAHFHLLNPCADFGPFREMVDELFPTKKPVFLVSASSGLGSMPGRVEITPIAVRPGRSVAASDIQPKGMAAGVMGGPQAKRVGDFVYVSTQTAGDQFGSLAKLQVDPRSAHLLDQTTAEMSLIVESISAICAEAGGGTDNLVRLRLYVNDIKAAAPAISVVRQTIGDRVPVSVVEDAGAAGWLGECSISADAIAYVPVA
jgi:enamine deaminase RidA (YjgF/YER057c/UK114 family)